MGRMYTVSFAATAVTAQVDLFEISPADDKPVIIHAICLGQTTEVADAAEEMIGLTLLRGHTTSGSGGTATTPRPADPNAAAAGFAAECCNTTIASAGTAVTLHADAWNIRAPYQLIFTPEMRPVVNQANTTLVLRTAGAPADSITMYGTMYCEEI